MKLEQLDSKTPRSGRMDDAIQTSGLVLIIFFVVLTLLMVITLALFAVGFFMAVTHWCDRSVDIVSAYVSLLSV